MTTTTEQPWRVLEVRVGLKLRAGAPITEHDGDTLRDIGEAAGELIAEKIEEATTCTTARLPATPELRW